MAVYGNMVITNLGATLYGKVQTGSTLTFTRMQIGSGLLYSIATQLTTALVSGTAYTSLAVSALSGAIVAGDIVVIGTAGTTQTVTASANAASGATSISVASFTANANYAISATVTIDQNPVNLTALITPIGYIAINSITASSGTANVRGVFENTSIGSSTYTCEIGLYAQDPTAGEILYAYANAGAQGDTIPPYSSGPYSRQFQINTAVGNSTSVTATIPANTYVPVSDVGANSGVASLDASGHIPAAQLANAVLASEVGAASGVASLDSSGNVPLAQLGNVSAINTATTTSPGTVETSVAPTGTPVAVITADPSYAAIHGGTYVSAGPGIGVITGTAGAQTVTNTGVTSVNGSTGAVTVTVPTFNPVVSPFI